MRFSRFFIAGIGITLALSGGKVFAQDDQPNPPRTELLTMNGGKPPVGAEAEGIISFKTDDIYKRGQTKVKPFDGSFKIELPVGYTLFNKLAYMIETDAQFSGPNDFTFRIPSAATSDIFSKLRVLYPDHDPAQPDKPRWTDITIAPPFSRTWKSYLSKPEFDRRLPDFNTRTLHAFTETDPRFLIVALKNPDLARDKFAADLELTGSAPQQVMEGRQLTYDLKIYNHGPDAATNVSLHADPTFEFVSVTTSQGTCRAEASNVYCKFPRLEKGAAITVKIVEQCGWGEYFHRSYEPREPPPRNKFVQIGSDEVDPDGENNFFSFLTAITEDPNKAPVAEIIGPKRDELISGPTPDITIAIKASDPDGFVAGVELFDWGEPIGKATLKSGDEYELVYRQVPFGRHALTAKVTDNLGRETVVPSEFFINGLSEVEIVSPKEGAKLTPPDEGIQIVIHATNSKFKIKEVDTGLHAIADGGEKAKPAGNDTYVVTLPSAGCQRDCVVGATIFDESGVQTRATPVRFKSTRPPLVALQQQNGEFFSRVTSEEPFNSRLGRTLTVQAEHEWEWKDAQIVKVELFVDGKLFDSWTRPSSDSEEYSYQFDLTSLSDGTHKVQAVAEDSDGSVGKSPEVDIVINKN
jgi:hypothetical protein